MKRVVTHRLRGKLLVSAAVACCSAIALLAGAAPAGAAQPPQPSQPQQSQRSPQPQPQPQQSRSLTVVASVTTHPLAALPAHTHADDGACTPAPNDVDRTNGCWIEGFKFTFLHDGVPVGTTVADLEQSIHLDPSSGAFTEDDMLTEVDSTGKTEAIAIDVAAACASPCSAKADFHGRLADGLEGSVAYTDDAAKDTKNEGTTRYDMLFIAATFPPIVGTIEWGGRDKYRCDNDLSNTNTGCVFPGFTPTLSLSTAQFGAAAAMVAFAQEKMSHHWGRKGEGDELTRQADDSTITSNRAAICKDGTFKNLGTKIGGPGDKDSCDEFPFAATNQSGASSGSGADCTQVQAVRTARTGSEAAQWNDIKALSPVRLDAPCVRGHIPGNLNSGVGGAYGRFIQTQRLVDDDKFWVEVDG